MSGVGSDHKEIQMLFITNRFFKQGILAKTGDSVDFDLDNNASSHSIFSCERLGKNKYKNIGSAGLLRKLKDSKHEQILIYIHGFSTLPEAAFAGATEFQRLCDKQPKGKGEVLVVPLIWPCDNDIGIIKDYWDDQKAADQSGFSFARLLQKFMEWRNSEEDNPKDDPCLKRINVLAHSMGNRVLRQTLSNWSKYDLASGVPLIFRNTFMVAADVVNETLHRGEPGEAICHASRNVIVYHASDDFALRASKAANLKNKVASRRLGHTGPENMDKTPKNVYSVDCDEVNNLYRDKKGHTYFRSGTVKGAPGQVFKHIFSCLVSGRVFPGDEGRRSSILKK